MGLVIGLGQGFLLLMDSGQQGKLLGEWNLCGNKGNQCFSVWDHHRVSDSSVKFQGTWFSSHKPSPPHPLEKGPGLDTSVWDQEAQECSWGARWLPACHFHSVPPGFPLSNGTANWTSHTGQLSR